MDPITLIIAALAAGASAGAIDALKDNAKEAAQAQGSFHRRYRGYLVGVRAGGGRPRRRGVRA
jgi:hypothetical protein